MNLFDDRAQSEVIGVVLILGFAMISASAIFAVGITLVDGQSQSVETATAENELALFGSKVSEVALGDSSTQSVSTDHKSGEYEVKEQTATVEIKHINKSDGEDEVIEEFEIGEVTYEDDGVKIAYQGGGVWRHENSHTRMVSPPEFHYRSGTLTFPIVNITHSEGTSGPRNSIIVNGAGETNLVYPNQSRTYDIDDSTYENPVEDGSINVTVDSEYYLGWEEYFHDRTGGNVSTNETDGTTTVELVTLGDQGRLDIEDNDPIVIRAAEEEEPIEEFNLTLTGDGASGLNNFDWGLDIDGDRAVELHGQGNGEVDVTINDPDDDDWEWEGENVFQVEEEDGTDTVDINLTSDESLEGTEKELGEVFNELIERHGPDVDLVVSDKHGSQRVDHDRSSAYVMYESTGYVTYMQVTENEVEVRVN